MAWYALDPVVVGVVTLTARSAVRRVDMAENDDDLPRLPTLPEPMQLPFEPPKVAPAEMVLKSDWVPFTEPELLNVVWARRWFIFARLLLCGWVATLVIAAIAARSNAVDGLDRGGTVRAIGWIGLALVGMTSVLGWRWSDRHTRNIHRLEARLPTRFWCVRAWVAPLLWGALLAVTVLQLRPGELLDVRPPIVVPIFAAALWRPYALVRRMLASLIRVRSDALIGTAFVLDLAAFGLLWWQLWTWPDLLTSVNLGNADVFIGVSAAAGIAMVANLLVWASLTGAVGRAQGHRLTAIRTRHDHRQLRLRGIDPMDRQVRWALLRIRQQAHEESQASESVGRPATTTTTTMAASPTPETVERAARERVGSMEGVEEPTSDASEPEAPSDDGAKPPITLVPSADDDAKPPITLVRHPADGAKPPITLVPSADDDAKPPITLVRRPADDEPILPADEPSLPTSDGPADGDRLTERLRELASRASAASDAQNSAGPVQISRAEQLREQLRQVPDNVILHPRAAERFGLLGARFEGDADIGVSGESLLQRLGEFGITPGPVANEPVGGWHHDEPNSALAGWSPPKLYGLEVVRYILILAIVAVVTTSVWITYRSVTVGNELVDGIIGADDVRQLDLARRATVVTLGIATAMVSLWAAVLITYARRAGGTRTGARRLYALFGLAIALNVLAYLLDGSTRGTVSLLFLLGSLATAVVAALLLAPAQRWLDPRMMAPIVWTFGLVLLVITSWLGGLQTPFEPDAALDTLTFIAAFQTIFAGVIAVVVTLSTSDLVDEMQLALARVDSVDLDEDSETPEDEAR